MILKKVLQSYSIFRHVSVVATLCDLSLMMVVATIETCRKME
jgi:hypothetical protein